MHTYDIILGLWLALHVLWFWRVLGAGEQRGLVNYHSRALWAYFAFCYGGGLLFGLGLLSITSHPVLGDYIVGYGLGSIISAFAFAGGLLLSTAVEY
jgi:hypothetical protein